MDIFIQQNNKLNSIQIQAFEWIEVINRNMCAT